MSALNVFTKVELITQINKLTDNNKELQAEIEHLKQTVIDLADKLDDTVEECASKYTNMAFEKDEEIEKLKIMHKMHKDDYAKKISLLEDKYETSSTDLLNRYADKEEALESKLEDAESENNFLAERLHAIEQRHLQITVYNHAL